MTNPEHVRKCPRCMANPRFRIDYPVEGEGMIVCDKCGMHTEAYVYSDRKAACREWNEICNNYLENAEDTWDKEIVLKECPCCGTKPNIIYDQVSGKGYIICEECGIRTGDSQSLDIIAEIWNSRTHKPVTDIERSWW